MRRSRYRRTRRAKHRSRANRSRRSKKQKGGAQDLQIAYLRNAPLQRGQLLLRNQTQKAPNLQNLPSLLQPEHTYLLVMYDPDVPPAAQPGYLHWLKADITQTNPEGTTLVPYQGPNPPPGSGTHRYIFALVEQEGASVPQERVHFDGPAFLQTQGPAIAGTQFTVAAP